MKKDPVTTYNSFFMENWEKIISIVLGVIFVFILLSIAFFIKEPTDFQIWVFRVILSLAAGGITVTIPGTIHININNVIKAWGSFAVFVLVYMFNPPALIVVPIDTYQSKIVEVKGKIEDSEDGVSLNDAKVEYVVNSNLEESKTDFYGNFILKLESDVFNETGILTISAKNYQEKVIYINLLSSEKVKAETIELSRNVSPQTLNSVPSILLPKDEEPLTVKDDFFSKPASPKIWFQEAKYYSRMDKDVGSSENDDIFSLKRTYNSANHMRQLGLGLGWSHQFDSNIMIEKSTLSKIIFFDKSGNKISFEPAFNINEFSIALSKKNNKLTPETSLQDAIEIEKKSKESYFLSNMEGLVYFGMGMNLAQLTFDNENIVIRLPDNDRYVFDRKGRLVQIVRSSIPKIELRYDPIHPDRLVRIVTETGDKYIAISYNEQGNIIKSKIYDGSIYLYDYDSTSKLLLRVQKNNKVLYEYNYDETNRISKVNLLEKEPLFIYYNEVGWRKQLKRGSSSKHWSYSDSEDYSIVETKYEYSEFDEELKEYIFNNEKQILTIVHNGIKTEYTLTQCGCMPLEVKSDFVHKKYEYDTYGKILKIEDNKYITNLTYHDNFDKITSVYVTDKETSETLSFATYS